MSQDGSVPQDQPVSFNVVQTIRSAQQQHGLRHGDYGRYRQYCTKRLRRLYKSTKFLHGRGRFAKKILEPDMVADARFLAIPLLSAERAWAMAMEIKGQLAIGPAAPKRAHLQARLWKAEGWAEQLAHLASVRGDHQTCIEAEAYAAWISGTALLEKEADWDSALGALVRAKQLWEQLSAVGSADFQAAARAQAAEAEPGIRYCSYKLGNDASSPQLAHNQADSSDFTSAKLAALNEGRASLSRAEASDSSDTFVWHGISHALPSKAAVDAVHAATELRSQLDTAHMDIDDGTAAAAAAAAKVDSAPARQLLILDKLASAYANMRSAASEAAAADVGSRKSDWETLEVAARGANIEASIRRAHLQAGVADARLSRTLASTLQAHTPHRQKDKQRAGRPEEVVRIYDTISSLIADLTDVASAVGGVAGEALLDSTAAQAAACQAGRCYYTAHTQLAGNNPRNAHALFELTVQLCTVAKARHEECKPVDEDALADIQNLSLRAAAFRVAAHAGVVAAEQRLSGGVQEMSLTDGIKNDIATQQQGYMVDAMSACRSFAGGQGLEPRIAPLIPAAQAIPVRPIVLDIAQEYIAPPDLSSRLESTSTARSLGARLFGWR